MYKKIIFILAILTFPSLVFANTPPSLLSPPNNSSTSDSSPKLTWENPSYSLFSTKPFRAEIDNNSDFSSPEKDYTTGNTSYSPSLSNGTWYWKIKVKDSTGEWSDWSSTWQFTISSDQSSNPSSSSSPNSSSDFSIKDIPTQINSDQDFEVEVNFKLSSSPDSEFYLKGAFAKEGSSNYFGRTYVSNTWIKNGSSYSNQLKIKTDSSGIWNGKIKISPDQDDSGFTGTDNYIFKVAKYSSSGSGPVWSNEKNIKINSVAKPESETSLKNSPPPSSSVSSSLKKSISVSTPSADLNIASVAGESTNSSIYANENPETLVAPKQQINWYFILLGILTLGVGVSILVYKFKKS